MPSWVFGAVIPTSVLYGCAVPAFDGIVPHKSEVLGLVAVVVQPHCACLSSLWVYSGCMEQVSPKGRPAMYPPRGVRQTMHIYDV